MSPKVFWIGFVLFLLGFSASIQIVGVVLATSSPSFAVEPNYEAKARDWDKHRAQLSLNQRLGWTVEASYLALPLGTSRVTLLVQDSAGLAVEGASLKLRTFHNARMGEALSIGLVEAEPGVYRGDFGCHRAGTWIFELSAQRAGQTFTHEWRASLPVVGPAALNTGAASIPAAQPSTPG